MGKGTVKIILACAVLAPIASTGWQLAASELANYELQDELKDLASLNSARIGLAPPKSDEDFREAVLSKGREHDIALDARQITVERSGTTEAPVVYLAVDYNARIVLPGCTFTLHFNPTSRR